MEKEMWNWIVDNLDKICKYVERNSRISRIESEDIRQEICFLLCQKKELAKEIYYGNKTSYLKQLVKRVIYEKNGDMYFSSIQENKQYFSRFQRIQKTCEKYNVLMIEENAYKISHLMEHEGYSREEYSINHIVRLLGEKHESEILNNFEKEEKLHLSGGR